MTEREWERARDPGAMWAFAEPRMTARQRLLFAIGCCRRIWPLLTDPQLRNLVEIGESVADGQASRDVLEDADNEVPAPYLYVNWHGLPASFRHAYFAARAIAEFEGLRSAESAANAVETAAAANFAEFHPNHAKIRQLRDRIAAEVSKLDDYRFRGMTQASERKAEEVRQLDAAVQTAIARLQEEIAAAGREVSAREVGKEQEAQAELLRCVAGQLHRPAPDFDPAWRTDPVLGIVRQIYDSREFGNLPILADALEEAGCSDASILTHCRHRTVHARGCWILDQIRDWTLPVATSPIRTR